MDLLTVIKCKTSCKLFTLRRRGVVGLLTSGQTDYTMDGYAELRRSPCTRPVHSTPLHCIMHRLFVFVSAVTALLISQLLSPVTAAAAACGPPGAAMLSVRQSRVGGRTYHSSSPLIYPSRSPLRSCGKFLRWCQGQLLRWLLTIKRPIVTLLKKVLI